MNTTITSPEALTQIPENVEKYIWCLYFSSIQPYYGILNFLLQLLFFWPIQNRAQYVASLYFNGYNYLWSNNADKELLIKDHAVEAIRTWKIMEAIKLFNRIYCSIINMKTK